MSDDGHASRPVNRPLNDRRFNNAEDFEPGDRPYLGVCLDCGLPNSAHSGRTGNVPVTACPSPPEEGET